MVMTLNDKSVTITNFFESINENPSMTATNSFVVSPESSFQDYSDLKNMQVSSCSIVSNTGVEIPVQGLYTCVANISISYEDSSNYYTVNIVLT